MDCWSMKKNFVISEKENKLGEQVDELEKTTARRCIYSFKKVSNWHRIEREWRLLIFPNISQVTRFAPRTRKL